MAKGLQRLRRAAELGVDLSALKLERDTWTGSDGRVHFHARCGGTYRQELYAQKLNILKIDDEALCERCIDIGVGDGHENFRAINTLARHDLLLDNLEDSASPTEIAVALQKILADQKTLGWVESHDGLAGAAQQVQRRSKAAVSKLRAEITTPEVRHELTRHAIIDTLGTSKKRGRAPAGPEGIGGEHDPDEWDQIRRAVFGVWRKRAGQGQESTTRHLEGAVRAQQLETSRENLAALEEHWAAQTRSTHPGREVIAVIDRWSRASTDGPVKVALASYEVAYSNDGSILVVPELVAKWLNGRIDNRRFQVLGARETTDDLGVLETLLVLWGESDGVYRDGRAALTAAREVCRTS